MDLTREEDLIEEVARVEGMDAVPTLMPPSSPAVWATAVAPPDPERILRTTLAAEGYLEAVSLAFCSRKDAELLGLDVKSAVEVANPLGEESALLRPSLLPALLRAVRHNQDVLPSIVDLRLFELGRTFEWATPPGELPVETARVALVLRGHRTVERWNTKGEGGAHPQLDAYDLKAAVESALAAFRVQDVTLSVDRTPWLHPGSATALSKDGRALGVFGQLHPEVMDRAGIEGPPVWVAELMLDALVACAGAQPIYQPLPRHPPARRDLSFYLGREVQAADVVATLRAAPVPGMSVEDVEIFDVYEGQGVPAGKRSMAVAITYRAPDRTLTDAEVKAAEASVIGLLVERHAAEIRMA